MANYQLSKTGAEIDAALSMAVAHETSKADIDGSYDGLTAGKALNAEQIESSVYVEDKTPYNFRTSGGNADIGNRLTDKIVGGSIVWNQLVQNGTFATTDNWSPSNGTRTVSDNELTVTISSGNNYALAYQGIIVTSGHKVLMMCDAKVGTATRAQLQFYANSSSMVETTSTSYERIGIIGIAGDEYTRIRLRTTGTGGQTAIFRNAVSYDITAMFGSAIADYIYSLETATAGAGVAWFKKLFPKDYYAYNAGAIMSVNVSAHNTVGFNQWDEVWEQGNISDTTGNNTVSTSRIRAKNYIPVVPNTVYNYNVPSQIGIRYYDGNKNFIGTSSVNPATQTSFTRTTPLNCHYMRFVVTSATTYNNDICINLSWDGERNGEYEAYVKHEYPLDESLTLYGIPKLDSNNELYYDGDTYEADGTVTRNYEYRAYASGDESLLNAITDGTHTVVKLETPTTETADQFSNLQIVDDFGTEEYMDYAESRGTRDVAIPVGHETQYQNNLRAKLEMSPNSPDGNGDYIVRQTNGINEYVPLVIPAELPDAPTTDGTYRLTVTVADGTPTLSWVAVT